LKLTKPKRGRKIREGAKSDEHLTVAERFGARAVGIRRKKKWQRRVRKAMIPGHEERCR
jgi:hypothetical protein